MRAAGARWRKQYNLAADMGGMGFIENNKAFCMLAALTNTHLLMAEKCHRLKNFYASSACAYAADRQLSTEVTALKEEDAYPATPEEMATVGKAIQRENVPAFCEDSCLTRRVTRYHNVYGPNGTYDGGREKAPAAICQESDRSQIDGL
ncbi:MAG: NAD-dependent epimerase/dehydratase family protein [Bryobacteraceae bacterium]